MTNYFMDTSALGKRYISEIDSTWIINEVQHSAGNVVLISAITTVEVCSALARRERLKQISPAYALQRRADFLLDVDKEYLVIPADDPILIRARNLVAKHPIRTLDALQLASALEARATLGEPITFVSADTTLLTAAVQEGIPTDNPLLHP